MTETYSIKIKKPYDVHRRHKQHVGEHSRTQQNLRQETDINYIMAKYQKTGLLTHVNTHAGQYGDFSVVPDYKTGMDQIRAADEMFMSLPAKIRDRFKNDPGEFIDFATNPENLQEMRELGLAPPAAPVVERPTLETEGAADPQNEGKN